MDENKQNKGFQSLGDIFSVPEKNNPKKGTAYAWQDFALHVINELSIPIFKRSAVFKICKEKPREVVERAMNDTKELCGTGEKWKYFFKIISAPASYYPEQKDKNNL